MLAPLPRRRGFADLRLAREMRDNGECVVSGFHSALERDVLQLLLRGEQPLILVTARGLPKRYPAAVRLAIDNGRLLIASPFPASVLRITAATAAKRNAFMLSVAERIVIGHASRNGALAETLSLIAPHKEVIRLGEGGCFAKNIQPKLICSEAL